MAKNQQFFENELLENLTKEIEKREEFEKWTLERLKNMSGIVGNIHELIEVHGNLIHELAKIIKGKEEKNEVSPMFEHWKKLAGINKGGK